MEFYIDTAEVDLIKKYNDIGLVDGVTTNPTLIKKSGKNHEKTIREISSFIKGPISVEVLSTDFKEMVNEAEKYVKWGKNIVVKIPMTKDGMKAVRLLSKKGIKTNVTLVFSASQALIAAKAGASYVSPFIGRLDEIGIDGLEVVSQILDIFENYCFDTKVIAASIRDPEHVKECSLMGCHIATIPPGIIDKLFNHPLTDIGLEKFLEDAKAWKK
jgi:transaldolase